jgi:hypothetical protein
LPDIWLIGSIKPIYNNKGLQQLSEEAFLLEKNPFEIRKSYSTTDRIFTLFSFFDILKGKKKNFLVLLTTLRKRLTRSGEKHCGTNSITNINRKM